MSRNITHNSAQQRFEWLEDGALSVIEYELNGDVLKLVHTEVPEAVGGRGIASDLARHALETARSKGWKVLPACDYVATYIKRHPQYQDIVA